MAGKLQRLVARLSLLKLMFVLLLRGWIATADFVGFPGLYDFPRYCDGLLRSKTK